MDMPFLEFTDPRFEAFLEFGKKYMPMICIQKLLQEYST
jgi:hypothetical protein